MVTNTGVNIHLYQYPYLALLLFFVGFVCLFSFGSVLWENRLSYMYYNLCFIFENVSYVYRCCIEEDMYFMTMTTVVIKE